MAVTLAVGVGLAPGEGVVWQFGVPITVGVGSNGLAPLDVDVGMAVAEGLASSGASIATAAVAKLLALANEDFVDAMRELGRRLELRVTGIPMEQRCSPKMTGCWMLLRGSLLPMNT